MPLRKWEYERHRKWKQGKRECSPSIKTSDVTLQGLRHHFPLTAHRFISCHSHAAVKNSTWSWILSGNMLIHPDDYFFSISWLLTQFCPQSLPKNDNAVIIYRHFHYKPFWFIILNTKGIFLWLLLLLRWDTGKIRDRFGGIGLRVG